MGLETAPFFGEFTDAGERKDLKSAAVGQYGAVPPGETVQAAGFVQGLGAGTQVEVVGVAQDDLCADFLDQVAVEHALDAAYGADGHKNGGAYLAVVGTEHAGSCR